MDTLLDALQEGRLIELPDNDKNHALQFLSHILEAIPSVPNNTDVAGLVLKREESFNTALGKGFAVPHARVPFEGDLLCAVGWSPNGINYGASDNNPVHIVIMYLVPSNQRNQYLKEVSNIAKALMELHDENKLKSFNDLNSVRNYLLDMISTAKDFVGPEARARMIQLEVRESLQKLPPQILSDLIIEPITIIKDTNGKIILLTQNKELFDSVEKSLSSLDKLSINGNTEISGWRIIKRYSTEFISNRALIDCIAIKILSK
ncbi:MAG: PTS sugar transporter subunit IIA [Melioribacter sp.]|uniref:PTS sugar transporter subunit IIA n=1 Tax=Rosettibacter primus TaxID=3111523 RepID=UPI00247E6C11|nr:PTS sugar transporter subunit IIA [Melioribacter sp.]